MKKNVIETNADFLPYSVVWEALRAACKSCQDAQGRGGAVPDRFVLLLNPEDREIRSRCESLFLDELIHEFESFRKKSSWAISEEFGLEIRTDDSLHQGQLRVECFANGRVMFCLKHDRGEEYQVDPSPTAEWKAVDILTADRPKGRWILVVDDEPVLCAVLQRLLTRLEYRVISARNGMEAMDILSHLDVDLVITDLYMPKIDGWTLLTHVKRNKPGVPVILMTGYHSMHAEMKAVRQTADGYISKPFSFETIKTLLEEVFCRKESRHSVSSNRC